MKGKWPMWDKPTVCARCRGPKEAKPITNGIVPVLCDLCVAELERKETQ